MSAGTNASTEESQTWRKAAPLLRSLPSPLNKLHKRWPSMKAEASLYSFRFVLLLERIPMASLSEVFGASPVLQWVTARLSHPSIRFGSFFLERIPVKPAACGVCW
jgi:hypothetical protein